MRASIKIILDETFTSNFLMSTHGNYLWPLFAHSGIYSNSYKLLQFTILDRTARLSFTKTIRYFPSVHKHSRAKYFPSYLNISLQTLLSKHFFRKHHGTRHHIFQRELMKRFLTLLCQRFHRKSEDKRTEKCRPIYVEREHSL